MHGRYKIGTVQQKALPGRFEVIVRLPDQIFCVINEVSNGCFTKSAYLKRYNLKFFNS